MSDNRCLAAHWDGPAADRPTGWVRPSEVSNPEYLVQCDYEAGHDGDHMSTGNVEWRGKFTTMTCETRWRDGSDATAAPEVEPDPRDDWDRKLARAGRVYAQNVTAPNELDLRALELALHAFTDAGVSA